MTKKIIKPTRKELPKKLREPIALEPMPSPPAEGAKAIWPELKVKHAKEVAAVSQQNAEHQFAESMDKLGLLLDHYALPRGNPDSWFLLAFYLAQEYVPGFKTQVKANAGRTKTWDATLLLKLYLSVEQKIATAKSKHKRITLESVCQEITKEEPWKTIIKNAKDPGGVLYDRYMEARKTPTVVLITNIEKDCPDAKERFSGSLERIEKMFPRNSR